VGELLPRAEEAIGVRYKLATYSLNASHKRGSSKARGFATILGITIDSLDYLERQILAGISEAPLMAVRPSRSFGFNCAVDVPVRGVDLRGDRIVRVRTAWLLADPDAAPRLTSAYVKP
jgi:hypothetical protein